MRRAPINIKEIASARDTAVKKLRVMIRNGNIRCGQRIDQRNLARELDLTTAPLREALSCLESEGLVHRIPGLGMFCKAYTVDEVQNLIEIRGALEALAAAKASRRLTPENKEKLFEIARRVSDTSRDNKADAIVKDHVEFHTLIAESSGNDQLKYLLEQNHIIEEVLSNIAVRYWSVGPHDHMKVAEAIASGDPEAAEKAMKDHIAPTYVERLKNLREKYGDEPIM